MGGGDRFLALPYDSIGKKRKGKSGKRLLLPALIQLYWVTV